MTLNSLFISRHSELVSLRASRAAPYICPDSTPVLFFGDLDEAALVTVGINPSWREFLSEDGVPLRGAERRFAHESDMSGNESTDSHFAIQRMRAYFRMTPDVAYWRWFRPVQLLAKAFGCSLIDGTAAHTDVISCFATLPAWAQLDREIHAHFAQTGYETFVRVVHAAPQVDRIFLLGPRARRAFAQNAGVTFKPVGTPFEGEARFRPFQPVLSVAYWPLSSRRNLHIIAVAPYRNVPLSPLSGLEIAELPCYL